MTRFQEWDAFVAGTPDGSVLQSSRWGALKANFGWDWDIVTLASDDGILGEGLLKAGALVLYRRLPLGLGTIAYVPRGPVVNWDDAETTNALLQALTQAARRRRAWALWLEPALLDSPEARHKLQALGLRPTLRTIQPARTILVDIAPSEDEILAAMKQKTRYNIRLSERKGVSVRRGDLKDTTTFYALMTETGTRDDFGIHSEAYYRRALELFLPNDQATLLLAEVKGEPVAGLIAFAIGHKSWYFYGASSNRHRKKMPTYALQWEAIRWAKQQGCTSYDLWGIPDADEESLEATFTERSDGLWGVYRFKRGFGGHVVRYVGLWERSLNPLYPLVARLQTLSA